MNKEDYAGLKEQEVIFNEHKKYLKKIERRKDFKRKAWLIGRGLFCLGMIGASLQLYKGFKEREKEFFELQALYKNTTKVAKELETKNTKLEKIVNTILPELEERIDKIEESDPGIMWDAENLINKLKGGYRADLDLKELEFLVTIIPDSITKAQHILLERKHNINLYKPTKSFIKNHSAEDHHTYVTSEQGLRIHVKFNVDEKDLRDLGGDWFYIRGEEGSWKMEIVKGRKAFVKDVPHRGVDLYNYFDKRVFARHEGKIILFRDFHKDGIEDLYNDPLGRSVIYEFKEKGKRYRVQLSHLNDDLPIGYRDGDKVYPGDVLGIMGKTGFATGTHLDVRYFKREKGYWKEVTLYSNRTFDPGENYLYVDWIASK